MWGGGAWNINNVPVVYMARGVMILIFDGGKSISRAIGRALKIGTFLGPKKGAVTPVLKVPAPGFIAGFQ